MAHVWAKVCCEEKPSWGSGEAGLGGGKEIVLHRRTRKFSEIAPLE